MQDITQALRMFRTSPAFTATAVLALAIGIGANTAVFSLVNAVILKPVPFPEPDRLVQLVVTGSGRAPSAAGSPARYVHWRRQSDVIEDVAAYRNLSLSYAGGDTPERILASQVTEPYFRTFRAPIERGRPFTADEDSPGAAKTVVVSHDFWTRRLGADPAIVGKVLSFSGVPFTVVGVMAPEFDTREFGDIDVWVPYQIDPNTTDQGEYFRVAARLEPGVSLEQAQGRLAASTAAFRERFPVALPPNLTFGAVPFQDAVAGTTNDALGTGTRTMLWTLLGAVGLVLLIACANVAGLMLVRASGRSRELAIRSALGAGYWRIVRQLFAEGMLLAVVGGVLGLVLGLIGVRALLAINTAGLPRLGVAGTLLGLDWRVAGFTVALSLVTAVLFSLAPALAASREDLTSVIKSSSSRQESGFRLGRTRSILIVGEVGLAVVLLIGASLLIRTLLALTEVDPRFAVDDVLVMHTSLDEPRFRAPGVVDQLLTNTFERLRAMPGVAAATATGCCVPLQPGYGMVFNIIGRDNPGPFTGGGDIALGTDDYFSTFRIPLLRGRVFDARDDSNAPPVVVINRTLAERWWPDGDDPLEDRMLIGGGSALYPDLADEPVRQVIGIVDDTRALRLSSDPRPIMYIPLAQVSEAWRATDFETRPLAWIVRTESDPGPLAAAIRAEIQQSTGVPVTDVQTMRDIAAESISRQRANMLLMVVFGGAALLLAAIGIYGLMAYAVQQRTHEIGIRIALGAPSGRVSSMVIGQGLLLALIGTAAGLIAAFFVSSLLASVLFGVQPRDPAVFAGVPVILILVAAAAVSIPARRASRVDPLEALRCE
jgi:putative ABC transport system permease protein